MLVQQRQQALAERRWQEADALWARSRSPATTSTARRRGRVSSHDGRGGNKELDRFAAHHRPKVPRLERQRWIFGEVCAFAGLASTVPDLARFVSMHMGARSGQAAGPLNGTSLLEMREPVATLAPD